MKADLTLDDLIAAAEGRALAELAARDSGPSPVLDDAIDSTASTSALQALLRLLDNPPGVARTVTLRRERTPDSRRSRD